MISKHKTVARILFISQISISIVSCTQSGPKDDENIDPKFVIQTKDTNTNKKSLDRVRMKLLSINLSLKQDSLISTAVKVDSNPNTNAGSGKLVSLKDEVAKLFDPANQTFQLPDKVKNKLLAAKASKKPWAPLYVTGFINQLNDQVILLQGQSVSNLLHWIHIKNSSTHKDFSHLLISCPTYNNLDVGTYVVTGNNNFFYSLDCSGYLNAAIEGSGASIILDIKASASSALKTQSSLFIGGGDIVSPIRAAYIGEPIIDTITRIAILNSVITMAGDLSLSDKDSIDINLAYRAVWSSHSGSSSMNGQADLSANASINIGVGQGSVKGNVGGTVSRKSSFSEFSTYIVDEHIYNDIGFVSISDIKAKVVTLQPKPKPKT